MEVTLDPTDVEHLTTSLVFDGHIVATETDVSITQTPDAIFIGHPEDDRLSVMGDLVQNTPPAKVPSQPRGCSSGPAWRRSRTEGGEDADPTRLSVAYRRLQP